MKATEFQGASVLTEGVWRDLVGLTRVNELCFRPWPSHLGTRRTMPRACVVNQI